MLGGGDRGMGLQEGGADCAVVCWRIKFYFYFRGVGFGGALFIWETFLSRSAGTIGVVGGQMLRNDSSGGSDAQLCNFDARVRGVGLLILKSKRACM